MNSSLSKVEDTPKSTSNYTTKDFHVSQNVCVSFQCQYRSYQWLHSIITIFSSIWSISYCNQVAIGSAVYTIYFYIILHYILLHNTTYCNEIQNIAVFYVLPQDGKSIRPFFRFICTNFCHHIIDHYLQKTHI